MKALTVWNPWAYLIATGRKRFETRGWNTRYRGPLLIHAAKRWTTELEDLSLELPLRRALGLDEGPQSRLILRERMRQLSGCALCVVRLSGMRPTASARLELPGWEIEVGNYADGRWAWELTDVQRIADPFPVKGAQGLWDVDRATLRTLREAA